MEKYLENKIKEVFDENVERGKILYWRMYQDKDSVKYTSVVITQEQMIQEVEYIHKEFGEEYGDYPVFEPCFMTKEEFENLPEFEGF